MAQVRPLGQLQRLSPSTGVRRPTRTAPVPREPAGQAGSIVPHSAHAQQRSRQYHSQVVDHLGGSQGQRLVDRLNPTQTVPAHRSFPGLAN